MMGSITDTPTTSTSHTILTDYLIVGAGPAGASLSCFLARYNLHGLLISSAPGTAKTPRAHLSNSAALECLRDIDYSVYDECVRLGNGSKFTQHYRWCETMVGEEYARKYAWGNGDRKSEYDLVSPCGYLDLPQSLMEPVLLKYSSARGWGARFSTKLTGFEEVEKDEQGRGIIASLVDEITGLEYKAKTKYLFGADGGRSSVAKTLDLPFTALTGGGFAYNVLLRADLTHIMHNREGNLHVALRLEKNYPFLAVMRQVVPWTEWVFVFFPKGPDAPIPKRSFEEWAVIAKDVIGDPSVEVEILDVSGWMINETSADVISKGNVYCLGDAIHRHPPTLGLGSNTCIQDSFNLAWKIAMVEQKLAHPSLLSTYNTERQPIGAHLVTESNDILRLDIGIWKAFGALQPDDVSEEEIAKSRAGLSSNTKEGRERRKAIQSGVKALSQELHALGTAMGQRYESFAINSDDEQEPFKPSAKEAENPQQHYDPCTYPGRRLPHVWLGKKTPGQLVSTLDIAGKCQFTLFTGIGGKGWSDAANAVKKELGVSIKVAGIGRGLEWEDVYLYWADKCGIEEDGCVLVRPDYFVAWRSQESGNEVERLVKVMRKVLGFSESSEKVDWVGSNGSEGQESSLPTVWGSSA